MNFGQQQERAENCCIDDTLIPMLRCGKALAAKRKWPESTVSRASRPHKKAILYARFTCVA
jgi:hypothetical protein